MLTSKTNILAQNVSFKERKLRLRWLVAVSFIPIFGIYAAPSLAFATQLNLLSTINIAALD